MVNLSKFVERGAGLSVNQENVVKELRNSKDELRHQVDQQAGQLVAIDNQVQPLDTGCITLLQHLLVDSTLS